MEENPYAASPIDEPLASVRAKSDDSAQEVFWAWEKLRLIYNAIPALITVVICGRYLAQPLFWEPIIGGAIAANVAFCMGPVAEGYLVHLGANRRFARYVLFTLGMLLLVAITGITVSLHTSLWNY